MKITDYFAAIDFFEQMSKQVNITLEKGRKKENIIWQNYRHRPSLQHILADKSWFISDPIVFFNLGNMADVLTQATFNLKKKTLHISLCGGTIILQDTPLDLSTPEALLDKGLSYSYNDDYPKAEECFQKALAMNPKYSEAWNSLGVIYIEQNDAKKAEMCYRKAVEYQPDYSGAWTNLGRSLEFQKRYEEAKEAHQTALEHDPSYSGAWQNLGNVYLVQKNWQKAVDIFQEALRIDPENYEALTNLGSAYLILQKFDDAYDCFRSAQILAPTNFSSLLDELVSRARQRISIDDPNIILV